MDPIEVHIPENVLALILINYTVMQLMRMKFVCQRWRQLIESPYFVRLHFHANKNNSDYFMTTHPLYQQPFSRYSIYRSETLALYSSVDVPPGLFPFPPTMSWLAHGLFCFYDNTVIVLCNPATRTYNSIPPAIEFVSNYVEDDGLTRKMKILKGFAAVRTIGLGYSPVTNVFKIFAFVQVDRILSTCVYKLTRRSWLRLNYQFTHLTGTGVPFNESLHWTARPRDGNFQPLGPAQVYQNRYSLVSSNVTTHAFGELALPVGLLGNNLGLVNGSLAVFGRVANEEHGAHTWCIDVWVMQQYGVENSWTLLHCVGPLGYNYCHFHWPDEALLCGSDHYILDHRFEKELISCNINSRIIGWLGIYFDSIKPYKESMISVDRPTI